MIKSRMAVAVLGLFLMVGIVAAACGSDSAATEPAASQVDVGGEQEGVDSSGAPAEAPADTAVSASTEAPVAHARTGDEKLAAELAGVSGWINSDPFTLESQRGNVVLVDFWTYTCINCIRTLPYLKEWHAKYADEGLLIVGVHTPEFEFEKDYFNVEEATKGFGLEYPIAQDNDYSTWRAYDNHFWPAKYLIDKDGYVRYMHFGEGKYAETEEKIRELLMETGSTVRDIAPNPDPEPEIAPGAYMAGSNELRTRELYAGTDRNYSAYASGAPPYVMNQEYYRTGSNQNILYSDPGERINHFMALEGLWHNGIESVRHARATNDFEDYIVLQFYGTTVNVVMRREFGDPYRVRVTLDGLPLVSQLSGDDIMFDEEGNSFVLVDEPRMYGLVRTPQYGGFELKLSSNSDDFEVFAFTFGSYKEDTGS